jgi:hypothetical protein
MNEVPDAKIVVENQIAEALIKVRQAIANGVLIHFEQTYEPELERGVSYWGKAELELIGAYAKDGTIAVLASVKECDFPERVTEEFWKMLWQRVRDELVKKIPDLKWFSLEAYFFESLEELEGAAFQGGEIS